MEKVTAYKCLDGTLETDLTRAIAWNIVHSVKNSTTFCGEPVSFSAALWIVENKQLVIDLLNAEAEQ